MLKSLTLGAFGLAALCTVAVAQQPAASSQEQAACRSDAMKMCSSHIGKPAEMNACLKANKDKLSEACRKVVEARGG